MCSLYYEDEMDEIFTRFVLERQTNKCAVKNVKRNQSKIN